MFRISRPFSNSNSPYRAVTTCSCITSSCNALVTFCCLCRNRSDAMSAKRRHLMSVSGKGRIYSTKQAVTCIMLSDDVRLEKIPQQHSAWCQRSLTHAREQVREQEAYCAWKGTNKAYTRVAQPCLSMHFPLLFPSDCVQQYGQL
jgi:hypothetical protein